MSLPPEVQETVPGIAGSLTALLFFRDGWRRAIGVFVAGAAIAKFVGPFVAAMIGSSAEIAGYITGLFGIAIVAKIFDMISNFDAKQAAGDLWNAIVERVKR